jgi:hypothetical protein
MSAVTFNTLLLSAELVPPPIYPAACFSCGSKNEGPFVDLQTYAPPGFTVGDVRCYLCRNCAQKVALALGVIPGDDYLVVKGKLDEAVAREGELRERLEETLTRAVNAEEFAAAEGRRADMEAINRGHLERQVAELKRDPATIDRQALLEQVRAAAALTPEKARL